MEQLYNFPIFIRQKTIILPNFPIKKKANQNKIFNVCLNEIFYVRCQIINIGSA